MCIGAASIQGIGAFSRDVHLTTLSVRHELARARDPSRKGIPARVEGFNRNLLTFRFGEGNFSIRTSPHGRQSRVGERGR